MLNRRLLTVLSICSLIGLLALTDGATAAAAKGGSGTTVSSSDAHFAVVELFTSEGCSSCPPADRLLNAMTRRDRQRNKSIYTLAFHVDYWNQLGWVDPYSSHAWSQRQRRYGRKFRLRSVYTPQMIVNGRTQFVGSNRAKATRAVRQALDQRASAKLNLHVMQGSDVGEHQGGSRAMSVHYAVESPPNAAVLHVALVQRGLSQHVRRGENAGRTLVHQNVVRVFKTVSLDRNEDGVVALNVPEAVDRDDASIIAYVQDTGSMRVAAATRADLP